MWTSNEERLLIAGSLFIKFGIFLTYTLIMIYSKYRNKKTCVGNKVFDSKKEAARYVELQALLKAGEISDLQLQVPYELMPSFKLDGETYRGIKYVADFVYKDKQGNTIVEDAKGMRTEVYKMKRKLMAYVHKIKIKEV